MNDISELKKNGKWKKRRPLYRMNECRFFFFRCYGCISSSLSNIEYVHVICEIQNIYICSLDRQRN